MEEFWAVCGLSLVDDGEGEVWRPHIAVYYNIPEWSISTQTDSYGAPDPPYCLFHGWCEKATLGSIKVDDEVDLTVEDLDKRLDESSLGTIATKDKLDALGIDVSGLTNASTQREALEAVKFSIYRKPVPLIERTR